MLRRHIARLGCLATVIAAANLTGCGLGAGHGTTDVAVSVTRDFGSGRVAFVARNDVPGSETVMRMLERAFRVSTRYGGGFVESINGLSGTSRRRDWFYYVNGVEASIGAAAKAVHQGDRIWWDLHDWSATESVPAVVGSFPEPFVHGIDGKRLPTTLECAPDVGTACQKVATALSRAGVPAASQLLGTGSGSDTLGIVVGTWPELRPELFASLLERGPTASGVYARFTGGGLELLDPYGRVVRTLTAGAGLVAATATSSAKPIWLITGTDATGVMAAAQALGPAQLHDHFAVALDGNKALPLPLEASR